MSTTSVPWRLSSVLLALTGVIVAGIGIYFIVLRPSLLPEDIRFMALSTAEVSALGPRLGAWLAHVFRVLGGFALATGLLILALAATAFRERHPMAVLGAAFGGAASIGLMAAVNFAIDSDFKWLLLGFAVVWAVSLIAFWVEARSARSPTSSPFNLKGN